MTDHQENEVQHDDDVDTEDIAAIRQAMEELKSGQGRNALDALRDIAKELGLNLER